MLGIETKTRDGVLGVGLSHEMALLRRIYAYLGRADVVGFFPDAGYGPVLREGETKEPKSWAGIVTFADPPEGPPPSRGARRRVYGYAHRDPRDVRRPRVPADGWRPA